MLPTRPELRGTFGMVSSTHWLASAAGMSVLERGGNAVDAAVAAGFVLQVVEPHLNGLGGEVTMILYSAGRDEVLVGDGQGPAPAAVTSQHFRDLGVDPIPGNGLLPACVPGAFGAWLRLLAEFGTMRLRDVLGYAIDYAEGGYPLVPRISSVIATVERLFTEEWVESARIYLGDGVPAPGSRFRNPPLAATFRRILTEAEAAAGDRDAQIEAARRAFYEGFVAETIHDWLQSAEVMDSTGERHRGLLSGDDLARWYAGVEPPTSVGYDGDVRVYKTGPWGQGPVLLQQLALLDGFDLRSMGLNSIEYVHTVVECAKLAFADREAWYGDPAFVEVPIDDLLDADYARRRRALIGPQASLELRPGSVAGREPVLPPIVLAPDSEPLEPSLGSGEPTVTATGEMRGDTCHLDVVDRFGNMVAATPSGGWLQSSPAIPGLGFCLGTRGQVFWLTEGLPSSLAGGKRPRTTLSPSLAFRDGRPWLAFGSPGIDCQDQWPLVFFLAHTHFGLDLQEAIDAPSFNTLHFPDSFYPRHASPGRVVVEGRLEPAVVAGLRDRGHRVDIAGDWTLGRMCVAGRDPVTGQLMAAANPRGRQGYAVGR